MSTERTWKTIESGPFNYKEGLHPVVVKNYGQWKYHEQPQPGVLKHVAESGDVLWTVRAGTPRQDSVDFVRRLCDVADKYADGFLRFTTRSNVEFMTPNEENVELMINELEGMGMPVGGTKQAIEMRREVRWKEEDESLEYKYTMNQNGEVVSYFGHEEYDAAKGVFVYRSKWGESPETTSHASYNPATRTSHAQTVTTKSGAKTKTVTTTKRVGNDKIQQNLRVFENGQLVYTHDVVSTRIEENKQ